MIATIPRTILSLAALFTCLLAADGIAADSPSASENDEQTITSLEQRWARAYVTDDADFLDTVMNPAFVQTNVRGEISTKAEEVGGFGTTSFVTRNLNPPI